ncbi:MAG TPA: lipid II flippase MurJ, partial [Gammaproteobacteria bacterium]|nr:lipid II flippase MurJ [Gammaproteobacteria bacterium]
MQVNLMVDTIFASFLPVGSLSWLYYSDRLLEFPLGIFGVALATVVLPHLSEQHAKNEAHNFSASIDWALRWIVLIGLPATLGLVSLAGPILVTLFHYGEFTTFDVVMARRSLVALSLGLMFFISVKIFVSAFYAQQNTKYPVKIALLAMGVNVIFNILLIVPLKHAGLALASTLASFFNVGMLFYALWRQKSYRPMAGWKGFWFRMVIANGSMIATILLLTPELSSWLGWSVSLRIFNLTKIIAAAGGIYTCMLLLFGLRVGHLRLQSAT